MAQDGIRILSIIRTNGQTTLAWSSQPKAFYDVLTNGSLSPTSIWKLAASKVASQGTNTTWTEPGGSQMLAPQGLIQNYTDWYDRRAFSDLNTSTNYEETPVGAVCHAGEPWLCGVNDAGVYFQRWNEGKFFCIAAWNSARSDSFFAVGDPLVVRKSSKP